MVKEQISQDLKKAVEDLGYKVSDTLLYIPKNFDFGDYSTNIALQLAKEKSENGKQPASEIANKILQAFGKPNYLEKAEVVGNGFINFFIKNEILVKELDNAGKLQPLMPKQNILIEYGHVNPLKEIHIGHLRTFILGESLSRLMESIGYKVFRANYQGDIGLHIAKAIWGIKELGLPTQQLSLEEKANFMGRSYAKGNEAYEQDPQAKQDIERINLDLYNKKEELREVYSLARQWSLDYFEPIYKLLGIKYDRCFFESEVYERGKELALENVGKVFEKDNGAVIFPGEKYAHLPNGQGLHNRVFVTSADNPTYEAKEIGLAMLEYEAFPYDLSVHVVAREQEGYFKVVIKAIERLFPDLEGKKYHLSYGLVDLREGKMSSRTGNVVTVDDLVKVVSERVREVMKKGGLEIDQDVVQKVALGAIKFSYLKYSPAPDIVFDLEESVSLQGDSGPYVQYTNARIQSVLRKAPSFTSATQTQADFNRQERLIARHLLYFAQVVEEAAVSYHPNLLAAYLVELSKLYNLFYQQCRIIGSDKEELRLVISQSVGQVLERGLKLLGIEAPERM